MLSLIAMSVVLNFRAARLLPFSMAYLAVVALNSGVYLLYAPRFSDGSRVKLRSNFIVGGNNGGW